MSDKKPSKGLFSLFSKDKKEKKSSNASSSSAVTYRGGNMPQSPHTPAPQQNRNTTTQYNSLNTNRGYSPSTSYYSQESKRDSDRYTAPPTPEPLPKESVAPHIIKERVATPYSMVYTRSASETPKPSYNDRVPTPIPPHQKPDDASVTHSTTNAQSNQSRAVPKQEPASAIPAPAPAPAPTAAQVPVPVPVAAPTPVAIHRAPKIVPKILANADLLHKLPQVYPDMYSFNQPPVGDIDNSPTVIQLPSTTVTVHSVNPNTNRSAEDDTSARQELLRPVVPTPNPQPHPQPQLQQQHQRQPQPQPQPQSAPTPAPAPASAPESESETLEQLDMRLEKLKRKVRLTKRGAIEVFPIARDKNLLELSILIDGLSPKSAYSLRGLTDTLVHDHAAFKLITAEMIVPNLSPNHPDYNNWTHLDPECNEGCQGTVPGTVTLKYLCDVLTANLNSHLYNVTTTSGEHELPYVTLNQISTALEQRVKYGLSSSGAQNYTALEGIIGKWATTEEARKEMSSLDKQCEAILELLKNPTYCYSFLAHRSIKGLMDNKFTSTLTVIYQCLLAYELTLRLPRTSADAKFDIDIIVKADMLLAKRWIDNIDTIWHPNKVQYQFISKIAQQQIEGLIKFADMINWPYRDMVATGITEGYKLFQSGAEVHNHVWDWLHGSCLPGRRYSITAMTTLVLFSPPEIAVLGTAPYYHGGLMLTDRTYWRTTSVLGRVLGGQKNVNACLHWVGPCIPVTEGVGLYPQWINLTAREIGSTDLVDVDTKPDTLLPYDMNDLSAHDFETRLRRMELSDNWVNPHPPPPKRPEDGGIKIEIQGIQLTKNTLADEVIAGVEYSLTYYASLLIRLDEKLLTFDLTHNPIFICCHPCVGVHERHRTQLHRKYTIVEAPDLRYSPRFDHTLIVNVQGYNDAEVMARAWCAQQGRHAVIRTPQTCFCCAWEFARSINVKVIIYQ